jgi:glycosyltransferase involved in cell wall biosynthesis
MRIAFDHQIFGWQRYGGISRYIFELSQAIAKDARNNVHVVSPLFVNEYLTEAPKEVAVWGVRVRQIPRTGRLVRAVNSLGARAVLAHLKPDLVHETYYVRHRIAPRKSKVVLTVHDMIHERYPNDFLGAEITIREKKESVRRADHIICVSDQTRRDLIDILNVSPERCSTVHLGFRPLRVPQRSAPPPTSRPYILYVGLRSGYKNFRTLVGAVALSVRLKSCFDIVCFGGGRFSRDESNLMAELGFDEARVHQVGGDDSVLSALYRGASAFVYPSRFEGFGIPPLEALSCDCPLVCSDTGAVREVVGNAGLYFNPANPEELAKALERIVEDDQLRASLRAAGQTRVQQFSWEKCAAQTMALYNTALG